MDNKNTLGLVNVNIKLVFLFCLLEMGALVEKVRGSVESCIMEANVYIRKQWKLNLVHE